jgi:hypothetical protein
MATTKIVQLYKNKLLSDSGTETLPLKRNDMIVGLNVMIRAENGATSNTFDNAVETTVEMNIDKIEVRSGSAVFKSFDGEMCRKISTYRNGKLPNHVITGAAGNTWAGFDNPLVGWQSAEFPIDFCTKQDPLGNRTGCIMPAPLYDSLDLVIDTSFTVSATVGITTGTVYADVYALTLPKMERAMMENKRILLETKKADYTSVAAGDESFDLTLDSNKFLRQLYVNAYETGIEEGVDITDLQLKVEGNNELAAKWGTLQHMNAIDCGLNYHKMYYCDTGDGSVVHLTRVPAAEVGISQGATTTNPIYTRVGDQVTVTNTNSELYYMDVGSKVLPGMVVIDFDRDGMMSNMQYCGVKDLDLVLGNGGAGASVTVLEQHVSRAWGF